MATMVTYNASGVLVLSTAASGDAGAAIDANAKKLGDHLILTATAHGATAAATASTPVARDASGGFSAVLIQATSLTAPGTTGTALAVGGGQTFTAGAANGVNVGGNTFTHSSGTPAGVYQGPIYQTTGGAVQPAGASTAGAG
jgi:hypothetical protein